jgi:hypothetical protein
MSSEKVVAALLEMAKKLESATDGLASSELQAQRERIASVISDIGKSWSGSWIGYHARTYLHNFRKANGADYFDREWGLHDQGFTNRTTEDWAIYADHDVRELIIRAADIGDFEHLTKEGSTASDSLSKLKGQLNAMLSAIAQDDAFLKDLRDKAFQTSTTLSKSSFVQSMMPHGQYVSRDSAAMSEGIVTPPHLEVLALLLSAFSPLRAGKELAATAEQAAEYLMFRDKLEVKISENIGMKIFIGHGRSLLWRELKDFVTDRLHLEYEEFNREPSAGVGTAERLGEMLNACGFAFLVLTAEDEVADGTVRARENVVHEVGLFQGRYGFRKAIVLLENGCNEFSNIHGLGQLRFEKGNIGSVFEDVRRVLEREGLLKP